MLFPHWFQEKKGFFTVLVMNSKGGTLEEKCLSRKWLWNGRQLLSGISSFFFAIGKVTQLTFRRKYTWNEFGGGKRAGKKRSWKKKGGEGGYESRDKVHNSNRDFKPISGSLESVCLIVMNFLWFAAISFIPLYN